ncbi:MAG: peptidase M23 [Candidatus Pelagibacter sp.]|nr:peptidase M23 [Candidatus Pelagibacter sp.]|tara:strand:+ start:395 stop:1684 length:1290 start_codon:yes stop_codon:yes gene_type:complete
MKVFEKSQNSSRKIIFFIGFILFACLAYTFIYKPLSSQKISSKNNNISLLEKADKLNIFIFDKKANFKSKVKVKKNDTLEKLLTVQKIDKQEVAKILNNLNTYINPKKVSIDQTFEFITSKIDDKNNTIQRISLQIDNINTIHLIRDGDKFIVKKIEKVLYKKNHLAEGMITRSLYHSAKKADIDDEVIVEFARVFGFEIDFQRDIRKNDIFQIVYEKFVDDDGELQKNGRIIYAYMKNNGKDYSLYYFKDKNNKIGYFFPDGKSVEKALMKTPINGARLSSKFGMRKHPILGYNKMHKGTDFAARRGTPIMASGSGVVERARWFGAYGKYIRIRHNSTYKTAYAHLSKFGRGIKEGKKVRQGQIIGYVGSTGRSTGPHLHYEVLIRNKRVNSQKLKLPAGKILKGKDRENFEVARIKIDVMRSSLVSN